MTTKQQESPTKSSPFSFNLQRKVGEAWFDEASFPFADLKTFAGALKDAQRAGVEAITPTSPHLRLVLYVDTTPVLIIGTTYVTNAIPLAS